MTDDEARAKLAEVMGKLGEFEAAAASARRLGGEIPRDEGLDEDLDRVLMELMLDGRIAH